jgi:NADPH:quinone reductase-like Zn-dependent oxidoreductase
VLHLPGELLTTDRMPGAHQNLNGPQKGVVVQAITVRDRAAGPAGLTLSDIPHPHGDRTRSVPGHELSGVVSELGYGTTGLTVGQRVFGLADWTRDGSLAEYTAVEARNLKTIIRVAEAG